MSKFAKKYKNESVYLCFCIFLRWFISCKKDLYLIKYNYINYMMLGVCILFSHSSICKKIVYLCFCIFLLKFISCNYDIKI